MYSVVRRKRSTRYFSHGLCLSFLYTRAQFVLRVCKANTVALCLDLTGVSFVQMFNRVVGEQWKVCGMLY